jgi:hypothetical protein
LTKALRDENAQARGGIAIILAQLEYITPDVSQELISVAQIHSSPIQLTAANLLSRLVIKDETQLRSVLIALNRRLHDRDDDVRRAALTAIRRLLDGRQIPGYCWVPIRERREKARKRRILGYWVIGLAVLLLVAWVAAGVATYLRVDPFIERFVAYALGLVALTAGAVQVWGWFRRPPWDR